MWHFDPRIRLPEFFTGFFPGALWRGPSSENKVFLTFDDGPVPEVTPWVLDLLEEEDINACFFCVGENVHRYPEVFKQIAERGHLVGNHTYNHMQGLKNTGDVYVENVEKAGHLIDSVFFRPPHGWMKRSQYRAVTKHYLVVMWDLVSGDYRQSLSPEEVVNNVLEYVRPGSIITFHDSYKARKNLYGALPVVIQKLKSKGYCFGKLTDIGIFPVKTEE